MLLRSLLVYGFKSFAEKTQLEFGRGITAIVGPNGSGKSNISDAIRWTLGEQSAKILRGTKMEDIIFSGSAGRKPLGIAEVSLVFDNSDGQLALDYNEVIITRRVFRSGDSEYYINKTSCRLKDIYDLLSDTGIGRDSMTVIGQNKVDEILSSKPEERRFLFEEAAGIAKYKQRKKDALRKLESTEQNLVRLSDISGEIESQLQPLAESAAKTARFNELAAKLKSAQVTILLDKLDRAEKMVQSAQLEKDSLSDKTISFQTKLSLSETEKEKLTLETFNLEEHLAQLEQKIGRIDTELERMAGKNALLNERIEQGENSKQRIADELARLHHEKASQEEESSKLRQVLLERRTKAGELNNNLVAKNEEYNLLCQKIQSSEEKIQLGKEKTFNHLKQMVDERNNLKMLQKDLVNLKLRQKSLSDEHVGYLKQKEENIRLLKEYENSREEWLRLTANNEQKIQNILAREEKCREFLSACKKQESELGKKINEASSRLRVLLSMQKDFEGFGRGIKEVLKSSQPWRSGICGAVAELLTVKDEYVTAVEIALGGALQHIVAEDEQTAKDAIEFLKRSKLGRATFLPLSTIKSAQAREVEKAAAVSVGALGFVSGFVTFEERYAKIIEYLLGRTILAKNIDAALKIAKDASFAVKIVTIEGELLNPGGSLTGGVASGKEASFLARVNKIENLKNDLGKWRQELAAKENEIEKVNVDLSALSEQSQMLVKENREIEVKLAELAVYLEKNGAEAGKINLALSTVENEINMAGGEEREVNAKINTSQNNLLDFETQDWEQKKEVGELEEKVKTLKNEHESLNRLITELKIEIASMTQQIESIASNCRTYEQNESSLQKQVERLKDEEIRVLAKIEEAENEISLLGVQREEILKEKREFEQKKEVGRADKLQLLADMHKIEKECKDLRRKDADVQKRLHEADLLFTKYEAATSHAIAQITENLGLSLEEAKTLRENKNVDELLAEVSELEVQIADLGSVNPAAIEEYDRVSARYNFLKEQREDLVASKEYLTSIILEIDQSMSKQFATAFQAIGKHFSDIFAKLFGGGMAKLELVEPDNLLETGIEIIVEPPGKKPQNLALLSGGEKALTVIALLFAFLTYRPAPFCVVDEIDASLDEANLKRFGDFLKNYAGTTQFIVVTHRKGTMEIADVLHGVTMEESGISRLVSVKLMDRAG